MSEIEWRTDEEFEWEESDHAIRVDRDPGGFRPNRNGRKWLLPAVIIALCCLAAWFLYRQISQRVETANEDTEAAVIASFDTLYQAAQNNDQEVFNKLISGRDRAWTQAYQEAVQAGGLYNLDPMQLTRTDTAIPAIEEPVWLANDLRQAVITSTVRYAVNIGNSLTQTVKLQQPAVFRQGEDSWLLAPPTAEFWGETTVINGSHLTFNVPERDAALVGRIHADLSEKYIALCVKALYDSCDDAFTVEFSADPAILKTWQNPAHNMASGVSERKITVPAPSLIGIPVDQIGYRALLAGYARQIFYPVMAVGSDYLGVRYLWFMAIADQQLARLGLLTAQELTRDDYALLMQGGWGSTPDYFLIAPGWSQQGYNVIFNNDYIEPTDPNTEVIVKALITFLMTDFAPGDGAANLHRELSSVNIDEQDGYLTQAWMVKSAIRTGAYDADALRLNWKEIVPLRFRAFIEQKSAE